MALGQESLCGLRVAQSYSYVVRGGTFSMGVRHRLVLNGQLLKKTIIFLVP